MVTITDITDATARFFSRHWVPGECGRNPAPVWSEPWHLVGEMPNSDRQGCYAFMSESDILYIGSGVGRGPARYRECGLGMRTWNYMRSSRRRRSGAEQESYVMKEPYAHFAALITIGFPSGYGYLALALEAFLISEFRSQGLINVKSPK